MDIIQTVIDKIKDFQRTLYSPLNAITEMPKHDPQMLLMGCVDARLQPQDIGIPPESTLIHRNIAALVPPKSSGEKGMDLDTEAVLQFAINVKHVKEIVVMGHTDCGGCAACVANNFDEHTSAIKKYLAPLLPARDRVVEQRGNAHEQAHAMEEAAVRQSIENLKTYPCVRKALGIDEAGQQVAEPTIKIRGWMVDTRTKIVSEIDNKGDFMPLVGMDEQGQFHQDKMPHGGQKMPYVQRLETAAGKPVGQFIG